MSLETYYRILKHDPQGKLVKDSGLIPSRSYVIQFLEMLEPYLQRRTSVRAATDVDNAESTIFGYAGNNEHFCMANAGVGDDAFGIVVGINSTPTAEGNENYKLDDKILHSATEEADKLNYQAVTFLAPAMDAPNVDLDITRTFLNESGGTITVKEIGIIIKNITDTKYHLLLRDVIDDPGEDVLDDYTLTVVYTLRTTV